MVVTQSERQAAANHSAIFGAASPRKEGGKGKGRKVGAFGGNDGIFILAPAPKDRPRFALNPISRQ